MPIVYHVTGEHYNHINRGDCRIGLNRRKSWYINSLGYTTTPLTSLHGLIRIGETKKIYAFLPFLHVCCWSCGRRHQHFIEGHADARPFSSRYIKDNQELSTKRALSAYNAITSNKNINNLKNNNDEFLMSVSGYGDKRPLPCIDSKNVCYSKDRRIDLRFVMEIPNKIKNRY